MFKFTYMSHCFVFSTCGLQIFSFHAASACFISDYNVYFIVSPIDSLPPKVSPPSYSTVITSQVTTPLTSPPASSYPAVLVGRSNNESKPKVPPPVPPRGTPKSKRGGASGKGATGNVFSEMLEPKLSSRHAERNVFSRVCRMFSLSYASNELALSSLIRTRCGSSLQYADEMLDCDGCAVELNSFGKLENDFL